MKPGSTNRLLEAYDECFKILGEPNFHTGIKHVCDHLQKSLSLLKPARTRRGLEAVLTKIPEPTEVQLAAQETAIRLLPYAIRKALPEVAKKLPGAEGGRPRILTPQDHRDITAQIGALLGHGTPLKTAVRRMADQHGVSESTIRKVWQARSKPALLSEGL